ncbi:MAG: hypothetical protein REI11_14680, partial [Patulibacter sp.]|nr:hypothetical protein [Patulibacter sp.]
MPLRGARSSRSSGYPAAIPDHRPEFDPGAARIAWGALQQAGGLVSAADLRERWGTAGSPATAGRDATAPRPLS